MDVKAIQQQIAAFADERDWEQFHSPKNLCMALSGEAAELSEHFQWLTEAQSRAPMAADKKQAVGEELADVFIYALRICDKLGIDLEHAIQAKIRLNAKNYPVSLSKGSITKYSDRS